MSQKPGVELLMFIVGVRAADGQPNNL